MHHSRSGLPSRSISRPVVWSIWRPSARSRATRCRASRALAAAREGTNLREESGEALNSTQSRRRRDARSTTACAGGARTCPCARRRSCGSCSSTAGSRRRRRSRARVRATVQGASRRAREKERSAGAVTPASTRRHSTGVQHRSRVGPQRCADVHRDFEAEADVAELRCRPSHRLLQWVDRRGCRFSGSGSYFAPDALGIPPSDLEVTLMIFMRSMVRVLRHSADRSGSDTADVRSEVP